MKAKVRRTGPEYAPWSVWLPAARYYDRQFWSGWPRHDVGAGFCWTKLQLDEDGGEYLFPSWSSAVNFVFAITAIYRVER